MPTATVCTEEFAPVGQLEAESLGIKGLPIVTVPHPIGTAPLERIRAAADTAVEEIIHVLVSPRETVSAEYQGKHLQQKRSFRRKTLFT